MPLGFDIDANLCTECLRCVAACSLVGLGRVQPTLARIVIQRRWPELPVIQVCRFDDCPEQPCIESCPVEAISRGSEGILIIDEKACTGCGGCVEVCPEVFRLNDAGYVEVVQLDEYPEADVNDAIMFCPEDCIYWEDEE